MEAQGDRSTGVGHDLFCVVCRRATRADAAQAKRDHGSSLTAIKIYTKRTGVQCSGMVLSVQ